MKRPTKIAEASDIAGPRGSPTVRLIAGLVITLSAVGVYSSYTTLQLRGLRQLQSATIDRNRTDSLLLLRIQNDLNSVAISIRDMLDRTEAYPLRAWEGQFQRVRVDLEDALKKEEQLVVAGRDTERKVYLSETLVQFWDALNRVFLLDREGHAKEAAQLTRLSLQARQEALTTAVARLLVHNNEAEQEAAGETSRIYARVERNLYVFCAAMLVLIFVSSLYLVEYNRTVFRQVGELSQRRSELARQLISVQEDTFRSIARELHDDFGQILTAVGALLQRSKGKAADTPHMTLREVQEIVQATLDRVRSLSHALHPVVLDEIGLEGALEQYVPGFAKRARISMSCEKAGKPRVLERHVAIQLFRVMQESLNNIARHSRSASAAVRLLYLPETVVLEVEDEGIGFGSIGKGGMGLISMRERAELVDGEVEFLSGEHGGALVRFTVPTLPEVVSA